jgi:outer membrane protein TolC
MKKILLITIINLLIVTVAQGQMSLTIKQAMNIAHENSPSLRTSHLNLEQHKQLLIAARASLKSHFALDLAPAGYSNSRQFDTRLSQWYTNEHFSTNGAFRVSQPILKTDGVISLVNNFAWQTNRSNIGDVTNYNDAFSNSLYLQITQPIFTYNQRKMNMKQLEFSLENANISYALQRLRTEQQITTQFYSVYTAQNNLEISREQFANEEKSFDIIKDKAEADLRPKEDLFQAELNLANARSSLDGSIVSLESAKDALKRILGLPLGQNLEVVAEVNIKPVDVDVDKAIEYGLNTRLELRQREIASEQLEFELIQLKAANEFKGDISLSFGLVGDHSKFGKIYNNPTQNPQVSITLAIPIFDWGEKKARIKAHKMEREVHDIDKEEERIDIEMNIRQTWRSLDNQRKQISIAEQSVRNAQLTYDLNLIRYREGDITGMEINQYQTQLSHAKMGYTQALINYKLELLNLKILSLFDFEKNEPVVPLNGL